MIGQWFKQDIEAILARGKRAVVCDAHGSGAFLLNVLPPTVSVMTAHDELEELEVRYRAEKDFLNKEVVFYTSMPKSKIKYLLEYAETGGMIDLTDLEGYIKTRLFAAAGVNTSIDGDSLVMAARLSLDKNLNWWKGVAAGIIQPFDLQSYIVQFICAPQQTLDDMDELVREVFINEVYHLIGKQRTHQTAYMMAREIMHAIFKGLAQNEMSADLLQLYYTLVDKVSAYAALKTYMEGYELPSDCNPTKVQPDHPFFQLDRKLTEMLSLALLNGTDTSVCLHAISERVNSKYATPFKADWLKQLMVLMSDHVNELYKINSLEVLAKYYQTHFCCLDRAMRLLYVAFLNNPETLRPLQYHYEQQVKVLHDKWFSLCDQYQSTQQGLVVNALLQSGKVAVIVGDGLRLEIADAVANEISGKVNRDMAFSSLPSVTECGMSALYGCDRVETSAQARFTHLKEQVPSLEVMILDNLNESVTAEKLLLTFGDIDQVGEKKQLAGLKDISGYHVLLAEKIKQLLAMGYNKVYLTTDHGFVITGLLDEADKIPVPSATEIKVDERFLLSNDRLGDTAFIEKSGRDMGYAYLYFAPTDKPFVSRGAYGYAHGGLTPQECIIPHYCFYKDQTEVCGCKITITNKEELKAVTGNYFTVKLKAEGDISNLFASSRKIKVQLYNPQGNLLSSSIETLKAGTSLSKELEMTGTACKLVIVDFQTTEQLDSCAIEISHARDIDDLF